MDKGKLRERWKGRYAGYVMIFFFTYIMVGALASVLSVYLTGIGKSVSQMSLIVSASGIFGLGVVPLAGYLCDRLRRPRLVCIVLLAGVGSLALVFPRCRAVWALFLLQGILGSFLNATLPVSEQLAASGPYRYGILRVWGTLGFALGAQAAGIAVEHFPPEALFVMIALSGLPAMAGYAAAENAGNGRKAEDVSAPSRALLLRSPSFVLYLAITFLLSGCAGLNTSCVPLMLTGFGIPMGAVGTVLSVSTLVEIPMLLFSNRFMDSFSAKSLIVLTTIIFMVQFTIYALAVSPWPAVSTVILLKAVASTLMMMVNLKTVRNLLPPQAATLGLSVVSASSSLGAIVIQNLGGHIMEAFRIRTLYVVMAAVTAFVLVLTVPLRVDNREKVFG